MRGDYSGSWATSAKSPLPRAVPDRTPGENRRGHPQYTPDPPPSQSARPRSHDDSPHFPPLPPSQNRPSPPSVAPIGGRKEPSAAAGHNGHGGRTPRVDRRRGGP